MTIPADEHPGLLLRSDHVDMCFATNQGGYDRADALGIAPTINVIAEDAVAWRCSSSQEQTTQQRYIETLISSQRQDQTVSSRAVQATCCASTSNRRFTNLQNSPHGKTEAAKECSFGLGAKPSKKFKDAVFVRHQDRTRYQKMSLCSGSKGALLWL